MKHWTLTLPAVLEANTPTFHSTIYYISQPLRSQQHWSEQLNIIHSWNPYLWSNLEPIQSLPANTTLAYLETNLDIPTLLQDVRNSTNPATSPKLLLSIRKLTSSRILWSLASCESLSVCKSRQLLPAVCFPSCCCCCWCCCCCC